MVSVPQNVNRIRSEAFAYCTSLSEIVIPSGITKIEIELLHLDVWLGKKMERAIDLGKRIGTIKLTILIGPESCWKI